MDSRLRIGLANPGEFEVDSLDRSSGVLEHIQRAGRAALEGRAYTLPLPRDSARGWKPELVAYWQRFGDQMGSPLPCVAVHPSLQGTVSRAIRVRPGFVKRMRVADVNIVLQRLDAPDDAKFDLLIATNI